MTIPAEHKNAVISSSMAFMRAITECYGPEKGMELWEQICQVLDPSVKGETFFAMITGEYNTHLRVSGNVSNRIASIKTIRSYTGLGLKEAKDLSDLMQSGQSVALTLLAPSDRVNAVRDLRNLGHVC